MHNILEQWEREKEYRRTEEHQNLCRIYEAESQRLTQIATDLSARLDDVIRSCTARVVRQEYAEGSLFLHRGFYCPSPAFDLIFATHHRGRLLTDGCEQKDLSHRFGFDETGRLLLCNHFRDEEIHRTEYLIYEDHTVYGLTVGRNNRIEAFSEEVYENGKLVRYSTCLFDLVPAPLDCCSLHCEELRYDEDGLSSCLWHSLLRAEPQSVCHGDECQFHRDNGFITHYTNRAGKLCKVSPPRQL